MYVIALETKDLGLNPGCVRKEHQASKLCQSACRLQLLNVAAPEQEGNQKNSLKAELF